MSHYTDRRRPAAIAAVYLCTVDGGLDMLVHALLSVAVLLTGVLVHEIGHLIAATRAGSSGDQIVLGPFGGLLPLEVPRERVRNRCRPAAVSSPTWPCCWSRCRCCWPPI